MLLPAEWTPYIKRRAAELGFMACGVSRAEFLEDEAPRLENWLKKGMHGKMAWMENHFDKRLDPRLLVDGAKSVISLLLNYYPPEEAQQPDDTLKISKYAYGRDYHFVIKDKLKILLADMQANIGEVGGRCFVDSAPVMDKAWAKKGGLGWIGKNSNLISPKSGSFFFIAELIVDVELDYDGAIRDYCGTCTKCLDACPTQAITEPYVVDGSKCISYFTIELKDQLIPPECGWAIRQLGFWLRHLSGRMPLESLFQAYAGGAVSTPSRLEKTIGQRLGGDYPRSVSSTFQAVSAQAHGL